MIRRDLFLVIMALIAFSLIALPGIAQEPLPPVFATNTPMPSPFLITTPAAALDRYALRPWQSEDLMAVLRTRVEQLAPGLTELQKAVQVTQYELARRFTGAPRNLVERDLLLRAMLATPPGMVDMRTIIRPFLETLINQRPQAVSRVSFGQAGFQIDMLAANIDGVLPQDAVFHVRYPLSWRGRTADLRGFYSRDYGRLRALSPADHTRFARCTGRRGVESGVDGY